MTDSRDNLLAVVEGIVVEVAAHMNITLVGDQPAIIAETITRSVDEVTAARVARAMSQGDVARIGEVAATHLRNLFFLQVGIQLGLTLGYTCDRDGTQMQQLGDVYNAAFEQARPDHAADLIRFPAVDDFVRDIIRNGIEYCHVTTTEDGAVVEDWRRISCCAEYDLIIYTPHRAATDGAAYICTASNGVVVYEEFAEQGVAHRPGAPAIIERSAAGEVVNERYFYRGLEHFDRRMVADA